MMRKYDDSLAPVHELMRYFNYAKVIYSGLHFVLIDADPPLILFAADNQKTDLRVIDKILLRAVCVRCRERTRIHIPLAREDIFGMWGHFSWSSHF